MQQKPQLKNYKASLQLDVIISPYTRWRDVTKLHNHKFIDHLSIERFKAEGRRIFALDDVWGRSVLGEFYYFWNLAPGDVLTRWKEFRDSDGSYWKELELIGIINQYTETDQDYSLWT